MTNRYVMGSSRKVRDDEGDQIKCRDCVYYDLSLGSNFLPITSKISYILFFIRKVIEK